MHQNRSLPFLFALLISLSAFPAFAQQISYDHVDSKDVHAIFMDYDETTGGCVIGIADHGELIFSNGYGMANLEYGIPLESDSRLMIASISKQFAAAAMLMMEQEGVLDLDENLQTYIPEIPDFDEPITARQLIHHTSGLRDLFSLLHLKDLGLDPTTTTEDALELIRNQQRLNFRPNTNHVYSNSGYVLMSVLTENLTGMTLREYTDKHFFKPLGMNATHFHDDLEMIVPKRTDSYRPTDNGPGRFYRDNIDRVGARGLFTTIEDFALWDANFIDNRTNLDQFTERMTEKGVHNNGRSHSYAAGLRIGTYRGLETVGHGGNYMGFRSSYMRFPEYELGIMVFCNMSDINPAAHARQLADLYLMEFFEETFSEFAGRYRNEGFAREYDLLIEDGDLYLKKSSRDKERLIWQNGDLFSAGGWTLEFTREDESITGFTVETSRTGKITFNRL
ncbi:serine hydrolase domain-containing protein [Rhodohalobacter sp. SW132]|nr:serine hydrolase domain-containing protein [Rhodohalobacter sp. SW132]